MYIINMDTVDEIIPRRWFSLCGFIIEKAPKNYVPKILSSDKKDMVELVRPEPSPIIPTQIKS
jgi:hypothetical protein